MVLRWRRPSTTRWTSPYPDQPGTFLATGEAAFTERRGNYSRQLPNRLGDRSSGRVGPEIDVIDGAPARGGDHIRSTERPLAVACGIEQAERIAECLEGAQHIPCVHSGYGRRRWRRKLEEQDGAAIPEGKSGATKDQSFCPLDVNLDHVDALQTFEEAVEEHVCTKSKVLRELTSPSKGEMVPLLVAWL